MFKSIEEAMLAYRVAEEKAAAAKKEKDEVVKAIKAMMGDASEVEDRYGNRAAYSQTRSISDAKAREVLGRNYRKFSKVDGKKLREERRDLYDKCVGKVNSRFNVYLKDI
jgi:hypothetical protein